MKKRSYWMSIAWTLVGILAVAGGLMSLGQRDSESFPSATSYGPSGSRALTELLTRQGFEVQDEMSTLATPDPDALYIAFLVDNYSSILRDPRLYVPKQYDPNQRQVEPDLGLNEDLAAIKKVADAGSNLIIVWLPREFPQAYHGDMVLTDVKSLSGKKYQIAGSQYFSGPAFPGGGAKDYVTLWTGSQDNAFVRVGKAFSSNVAEVYEGLPFTNRFIDTKDSASYVSDIVSAMKPKSNKVVFLEASIGNAIQPGIFSIIGPWAASAWTQIIFLFVLLVIFGAVRFGLPEERRSAQRGTRELVDALGETYARTRSNHVGMQAIYTEYDRLVRTKLKLPSDAGPSERNKHIPESLARAFATAQVLCQTRSPEATTLQAAKVLQREVEDFLGRSPRTLMRKRKSGR